MIVVNSVGVLGLIRLSVCWCAWGFLFWCLLLVCCLLLLCFCLWLRMAFGFGVSCFDCCSLF